ncbi:MAG: hypothetical protein RSE56_02905 [Bacilli bacterium]
MNYFLSKVKEYNKIVILFGLLLIFSYTFLSFVKSPYTGDIKVFMGVANQVQYKEGSLALRLFSSWDMKGIANRFLMYFIYSITNLVSKVYNTDKLLFEYISKMIYSLFIIIPCVISAFIVKKKNKSGNYVFLCLSLFFSILFFTTGMPNHLQSEMSIVIILFLCLFLLYFNTLKTDLLVGFLISTLFFFKSICILMIIPLFCGCFLLMENFNKKRLKFIFLSFSISTVLVIVYIILIYPQEFIDMVEATKYQSTLLIKGSSYGIDYLYRTFLNNFFQSTLTTPINIVGLILTIYTTMELFIKKQYSKISYIVVMLFFTSLIIIISNNYFIYHYYLFAFTSIVMVLLLLRNFNNYFEVCIGVIISIVIFLFNYILSNEEVSSFSFINFSIYSLSIFFLFIIIIIGFLNYDKKKQFNSFFTIVLSFAFSFVFLNFNSYYSNYSIRERKLEIIANNSVKNILNFYPEIESAKDTLFLDGGVAAFYINNRSYSKYTYNLPLQRYRDVSQGEWESNKSELKKY